MSNACAANQPSNWQCSPVGESKFKQAAGRKVIGLGRKAVRGLRSPERGRIHTMSRQKVTECLQEGEFPPTV